MTPDRVLSSSSYVSHPISSLQIEGLSVGVVLGNVDSASVGEPLCLLLGKSVGPPVGKAEWDKDGSSDGSMVGRSEGLMLGLKTG